MISNITLMQRALLMVTINCYFLIIVLRIEDEEYINE